MTFTTLRISLLFCILVAFGQNTGAAISTVHARTERLWDKSDAFQKSVASVRPSTKKEKKKWRLGQWLKKKFSKNNEYVYLSKWGRAAWLTLLGGMLLGLIHGVLFAISFCIAFIFAIVGLFKDEEKFVAISALIMLVITAAFIIGVRIAINNSEP